MSIFEGVRPPKIIAEFESKYNGKISVIQAGKTIKLSVNSVVQSINWDSESAQKMYWGTLVEILKKETPALSSVLVLGLAGAALQHLISRAFTNASIVSVEIDPVMVEVGKKYFGIDTIANHRIIVDDACRIVVEPEKFGLAEGTFDTLIVDICCGSEYPDLGDTGNFIARSRQLVKSGGLMVFNRIYLDDYQDEVNNFISVISEYVQDVKTEVIAGKTNSDHILIYGRVQSS